MPSKFDALTRQVSALFEWIGVVAMLVMMVITCVDVIGAKVFLWRLLGAIDIVQLAQIVAISFATSMTLIIGRHIQVEFFVNRLPKRAQGVINGGISLLSLAFFLLIIWRLSLAGYTFKVSGEHSATAYIPYYPFAFGIALACIPVCFVLTQEFLKSLRKVVQK
ncbi:MAG: TRAP transporter small permease [Desulfobacterota bacterium]|nr:TRAP transporter small permease [Thermodesulfobacteriota bacterium]